MGPENSGGPFVAYIDGEGVVIGHPVPEITPDHSAGGVSATEAAESLAAMTAAMAGVSMTMEVAAAGIEEFFHAVELANAIRLGFRQTPPSETDEVRPDEMVLPA